MAEQVAIRIFDVEHGACAMLQAPNNGRLAMVDSGHNDSLGWRPSTYIRHYLKRDSIDYLFITNADQDHLSDLEGLWTEGVKVNVLHRNFSPVAAILRGIKQAASPYLTDDIERFLQIHRDYIYSPAEPFNLHMGGVTCEEFCNGYPDFDDTNNLSLVAFFTYGTFTICFPGDLEEAGWLTLLQKPAFRAALQRTTVFVASHHGRLSGYCPEVFNFCAPRVVVVSDKPIAHETQDLDYGPIVAPGGVKVRHQSRRRHVLTTRKDGDTLFVVNADGSFDIVTERGADQQAA